MVVVGEAVQQGEEEPGAPILQPEPIVGDRYWFTNRDGMENVVRLIEVIQPGTPRAARAEEHFRRRDEYRSPPYYLLELPDKKHDLALSSESLRPHQRSS